MKLSRKLFSATAALGLAVLATVGSTYAWFSVNREVEVTGMTVNTKTSDSLLIAGGTTTAPAEAEYVEDLDQTVTGFLQPVSSINGVNFYYTTHAKGNGDAINDDYTLYDAANTGAFNTAYETSGAVGYVDYSFYLKATNAQETASNLFLSECDFQYDGGAVSEKAWRIAIFASAASTTNANVADASVIAQAQLKSILSKDDAVYFSTGKAVSATDAAPSESVVNWKSDAILDNNIPAQSTRYYRVVVRLWLEGEDTTCKNDTFAALTEDYTLDLTFKLATATTGVVGAIS